MPDALKNRPDLTSLISFYIETFYLLFSGQAIPLMDIVLYCDISGYDDVQKLLTILKRLENVVISHNNNKPQQNIKDGRFNNRNR